MERENLDCDCERVPAGDGLAHSAATNLAYVERNRYITHVKHTRRLFPAPLVVRQQPTHVLDCTAVASPKSSTFTMPSSRTLILAGFRSQCTTLFSRGQTVSALKEWQKKPAKNAEKGCRAAFGGRTAAAPRPVRPPSGVVASGAPARRTRSAPPRSNRRDTYRSFATPLAWRYTGTPGGLSARPTGSLTAWLTSPVGDCHRSSNLQNMSATAPAPPGYPRRHLAEPAFFAF